MHLVWVIVHAIHFNIVFSTSLAILPFKCYYSVIFIETVFCKCETHAKCLHSFWTSVYSGLCSFVTIHPQEVLGAMLKGCSRNTKCSNGTEIDNPGHWSTITGWHYNTRNT